MAFQTRAIQPAAGPVRRHPGRKDLVQCKFCTTARVVKNGTYKGMQCWLCRTCGRGFVDNGALPRRRYPVKAVIAAVAAFYSGWSMDRIREQVERDTRMRPDTATVYKWLAEVREQSDFASYRPRLGGVWQIRGDEVLKLGNARYRLTYLVDSETRFAVAARISRTCNSRDIRFLLETAYQSTRQAPVEIVTSGRIGACTDELVIVLGDKTRRIRVTIAGLDSCQRIPWRHSLASHVWAHEVKTPKKARRMLQRPFTEYNFFRKQERLGNRTPAEAAGIGFHYRTQREYTMALYEKVAKVAERRCASRIQAGRIAGESDCDVAAYAASPLL